MFNYRYHTYAFHACRALYIANKLNSSSTYPLLELFFKNQVHHTAHDHGSIFYICLIILFICQLSLLSVSSESILVGDGIFFTLNVNYVQ